jgi:DNA-binding NarL/FixJ family response regulator
VTAIHTVMQGQHYLSQKLLMLWFKISAKFTEKRVNKFYILSSREREVLQLIAEGKNTSTIAHPER